MKTAISVPDKIYREAERYARRTGKTRSQLYSDALGQYLLQHAADSVTQAMNETCEQIGEQQDLFVKAAATRVLRREAW